jgi:hypothetical protein
MILRTIPDAVAGEHALALVPRDARTVTEGARRTRFYPGRAVNDRALTAEQQHRERRVAELGRALTPGVVEGFSVRLGHDASLEFDAGLALTAEGVVLRAVTSGSVRWSVLPVIRGAGPVRVGVLVAEATYVEDAGDADPSDPCPRDTSQDAFERWARVDALRLARVPWPDALPAIADPSRLIEALAWQIFEAERTLGEGAVLPWELEGVPLALVVADGADTPLVVESWAVARRGARVRRTAALVSGRGRAPLWQARVDWFVDRLVQRVDLEGYLESDSSLATRWFSQLPPVGPLPADLLLPRYVSEAGVQGLDRFFPPHIRPIAEPIPLSQLDAVFAAAASLDPIPLDAPAAVGVVVPVPDALYDAELLLIEQVDPAFQQTIDAFNLRLSDLLWRRSQLRDMLRGLEAASNGPELATVFPDPDPDAVAGESVGLGPITVDPANPHVVIRPEGDPRGFIEAMRADGTLAGVPFQTLVPLLLGPASSRWSELVVRATQVALERGLQAIALIPGTRDRVHVAAAIGAVPVAGWMIDDRVERFSRRQNPSLYFAPVLTDWDAEGLDKALQDAEDRPLVVLAGTAEDEAWRPLQAVHYTRAGASIPAPILAVPPADQTDTKRWLEDARAQVPQSVSAAIFEDGTLYLLGPDSEAQGDTIANTGTAVLIEVAGLVDGKDNRLLDLHFTVDLVGRLFRDPEATLADDATWWRVASRIAGAEAESGTSLHDGGRVSFDLASVASRLAQSDSGLAPDDIRDLLQLGIRPFVRALQDRLRKVESAITLAFTKCQGGIYATRQLVLGNEDATRTTTSPVLATVGVGTTEVAAKAEVASFATRVVSAAGKNLEVANLNFARAAAPAAAAPPAAGPAGGANALAAVATAPKTAAAARTSSSTARVLAAREAARNPAAARPGIQARLQQVSFSYLPPRPVVPFVSLLPSATTDAIRAFNTPATPGVQYAFGDTGISRRVVEPIALSVHDRARSIRAEATATVAALPIWLDDVAFPGFVPTNLVAGGDREGTPADVLADERGVRFVGGDRYVAHEIQMGLHDQDIPFSQQAADEAWYIQGAVRQLEHAFQALRLVEGRLGRYNRAIDLLNALLPQIDRNIAEVNGRLAVLEERIAEARHDVIVARALLDEETARVAEVNARRDRIVNEHVDHLVFFHLRSDAFDELPGEHRLEPVLLREVVPECLAQPSEPPDELRDLFGVWREAPAAWFPQVRALLPRLGKLGASRDLLNLAVAKKAIPPKEPVIQTAKKNGAVAAPLLAALLSVHNTILTFHASAAKLDLGRVAGMAWQETQTAAEDVLTLGDLLDGDGVSTLLRDAAHAEVEHIGRVATCLYDALGEVPALLRLGWVTRLSQFDKPFDLARLSVLPRWNEVPPLLRQALQAHVDWLYGRLDGGRAEARALARDLVRVAILLASHAPVDEVIAGTVSKPTPVRPGVRFPIRIDPARIRVGMTVNLLQATSVVGKAVIEDLADGAATVSITHAYQEVTLTTQDRVQVVEPTTGLAKKLSPSTKATLGRGPSLLGGE